MLGSRIWWCLIGFLLLAPCSAVISDSPDGPADDGRRRLPNFDSIVVEPGELYLDSRNREQGLLVTGLTASGGTVDLTHLAAYASSRSEIAAASVGGRVSAVADGEAEVVIKVGGKSATVPVRVAELAKTKIPDFDNDVVPLLNRFGCNTSACHGKAEGQNGFKLSVFGSDPGSDYVALVMESRGRRLFVPDPERSLLLRKASGDMPHGGGVRIERRGRAYQVMRDWIVAGAPRSDPGAATVVRIELMPNRRTIGPRGVQQLRVMAEFNDGRRVDVTELTRFQSNNEALASVDERGLVLAGDAPGQVAIMASYMGVVDTFQAFLPRVETLVDVPPASEVNFIDTLVHAQLKKLNIAPTVRCEDYDFLRRAYIDLIGTLPTAEEARDFLDDRSAGKRRALVERLMERPEFVDYWSQKWADVLRVDRRTLGHKGAFAFYRWIHDQVARNRPIDAFFQEIIAARGTIEQAPQARFYQVSGNAGDTASTLSQIVLGVRIACAQCHHHPFDRWSQDDYYGMAAYFQPLSRKATSRGELLTYSGVAKATNPRTGREIPAHPLQTPIPPSVTDGDVRDQLAQWMTSPQNPWFARNVANRIWSHFLGRGLVEPVDDLRETNPPSNPELLDALANSLIEQKFDLRRFLLTITDSETYQRSSHPDRSNECDEQNYSRALLKRIDAEVLLDAVCQVTGVPEKFGGFPAGYRAIQLWDSEVDHYFLKLFGRPIRKSACVCERNMEPNVGQVLHVLNAPEIQSKLSHEGGRIARWVETIEDDAAIVEQLYLTCYARRPTDDERAMALEFLAGSAQRGGPAAIARRRAVEDLIWSCLNSLEFLFNH
jgi:hypothetical protein